MTPALARAGYSYNKETLVWIRQDYAGIAYSDGDEVERRIASIIGNAADLGVLSDELRPHCTDWPSLYHLSGTRANILRPFESELLGDILEIGAGCGAITRFLGECGGNVLALEGSPRRASIARARTRDLDNVTVVCDKFDDFSCDQKFDVVTLIGVLEYANLFTAGENPTLAMLERVRNFLKPSGKLIIAIENQLGLKYFAGAPEDHVGIPLYGIEARYRNDQPQTFGRKELDGLIRKAGFKSTDFLAPFPDYKLPVCIITEYGFSCDTFDVAAFAWQSVRRDPQLPPFLAFSPELVWPTIVNNGLALDLANSFLIVARQEKSEGLVFSDTLAWHFSSDRLAQYAKQAQFIRNDVGDIEVLYRRLSKKINSRFYQKLFNFNLPKAEPYKHGVPLLQKAVWTVTRDGWHPDDIGKFLLEYIKVLCELLEFEFREVKTSTSNRLPGAVFDLTPQNIIALKRGGYATIDHEWALLEPIELGHLLFRSLITLLNTVTKFGRPRCGEQLTRKMFVFQSLAAAGFHLDENDVERYLMRESDLRSAILGTDRSNYLEWEADKSLPIFRESEALQAQLAATEAAKANAEELAHDHLAKLEALQAQLA
ncbi:MAG: class I SAM-dependent methyltransferase, partial [Burkholderiales bacterium]|nr:class I SAM-dependent methyltransferase [Burkholderiales bacterium]